jgi:hypothetical protein
MRVSGWAKLRSSGVAGGGVRRDPSSGFPTARLGPEVRADDRAVRRFEIKQPSSERMMK